MPILSICIPTYNRKTYLENTLDNLTREPLFADTDQIQIVISDNCSTDDTQALCEKFAKKFPSKIKYIRQPEPLFAPLNIYGVLDYADGEYIKLQNDNIYFKPTELEKFVKIIQQEQKDIIFCINQENPKGETLVSYDNISDIVASISYMTTWMVTYCFKRTSYKKLENPFLYATKWMGSVDVLFRMIERGNSLVCYYKNIFYIQLIEKKGASYNVAEVFGKNYLSLLKEYVAKGQLSPSVFNKEKRKLLLKHINPFYFDIRGQYTFQQTGYFKFLWADYRKNFYFYAALVPMWACKIFCGLIFNIKRDSQYRYIKLLGFNFKTKRKRKNKKGC